MKKATIGFEISFTTTKMWVKMILWLGLILAVFYGMLFSYFLNSRHNLNVSQILSIEIVKLFPGINHMVACTEWTINDGRPVCRIYQKVYVDRAWFTEYAKFVGGLSITAALHSLPVFLLLPILLLLMQRIALKYHSIRKTRGQEMITVAQAAKVVSQTGPCRIPLIKNVRLPIDFETRHIFLTGQTGSGKTVAMSQMLQSVRAEKAIIFDYKGDYITKFYDPDRGDIIFNPADRRCVKWTIFNEVRSAGEVTNLVKSLIPDSKIKSEKFWLSSAQKVMIAILQSLWLEGRKTNRDLWSALLMNETDIRKFFGSYDLECNHLALQALGVQEGSGQSVGILGALAQFIDVFGYTALIDGPFSFKKWARDDRVRGWIFVECSPEIEEALRPGLSLVLDLVMSEILTLPVNQDRRIFFFIDELRALQTLPSLIKLITLGRSFGGCLVASSQELDGLKEIYGENELGVIYGNPWTQIALRNQSVYTARYITDSFGEREYYEGTTSHTMGPSNSRDSMSVSEQKKHDKVVLPSEINGLDVLEAFVRLPVKQFITRGYLERNFIPDIHPPEDRFRPVDNFQLDLITATVLQKKAKLGLIQTAGISERTSESLVKSNLLVDIE